MQGTEDGTVTFEAHETTKAHFFFHSHLKNRKNYRRLFSALTLSPLCSRVGDRKASFYKFFL
jgi:hypothetical protein